MYISPEFLVISGLLALAVLFVMAILIASAGGLAGAGVALWFLGKLTARAAVSAQEQRVNASSPRPGAHVDSMAARVH